jgi:hypothetical protein
MIQQQTIQFVEEAVGRGGTAPDVARELGERFPGLSLADGAAAIRRLAALVPPQPLVTQAVLRSGPAWGAVGGAGVAAADPVGSAVFQMQLLRAFSPTSTPAEIAAQVQTVPAPTAAQMAQALHDVFPALAAVAVGRALKGAGVFPGITAPGMTAALAAAPFPAGDVAAAVAELFPAPGQPVGTTTALPPVGGPGEAFDDTAAALATGQPLTCIRVRSGDIVDSIQAFYGRQATPLPAHGGTGGGPADVVVDPGDPITVVSGTWGQWFRGTYVLSLTFTTRSGKKMGPFGSEAHADTRSPFSFTVPDGATLLGFAGTVGVGNNGPWHFLGSLGPVVQRVSP